MGCMGSKTKVVETGPADQDNAVEEKVHTQNRVSPRAKSGHNKMFQIVEVDADLFKDTGSGNKKGGRVPLPLQNRLEQPRAQTPLDQQTLAQRMEHAKKKREEEREKRRKAAAEDVARVDDARETVAAIEERKAAELRKMIQNKTKIAENNRESTIDVVRLKKGAKHNKAKEQVQKAKSKPQAASLLGDLPPLGKCLLAPDVPENAQKDIALAVKKAATPDPTVQQEEKAHEDTST
eukprot:m51a1_g3325 hypothetical protein (236) ;mRNA; r:362424-364074